MFLLVCFRLIFILTEHLNSLCQVPFSHFRFPVTIFFSCCSLLLIILKLLILILRISGLLRSCFVSCSYCFSRLTDFSSCPHLPGSGGRHRVTVKNAGFVARLLAFPLLLSHTAWIPLSTFVWPSITWVLRR